MKSDWSGWICVFCIIERETDKNYCFLLADRRWETVIIVCAGLVGRVIICAAISGQYDVVEKVLINSTTGKVTASP